MAAERSHNQEPALFEEVTMKFTEEKEFDFDPYLFALSGNDLQQYCALLSWLEMQNHNAEMTLEIEEGIASPLSLVQVVEDFEASPDLYKGDEVPQTKEKENFMPLIRLQYNFVQSTDLQTSSSKFIPAGANVSLFPKAAGESLRKKDLPSKGPPQEKRSHPKSNVEGNIKERPFSVVQEEPCAGEASCPRSADTHSLNPNPVAHQQITPEEKALTANLAKQKRKATTKQQKRFRPAQELNNLSPTPNSICGQAVPVAPQHPQNPKPLKRPHQCFLCGKMFTVRSSVIRHQKLHDRERARAPPARKAIWRGLQTQQELRRAGPLP